MRNWVLAVDLGSSGVRAAAVDDVGVVGPVHGAPIAWGSPRPDRQEADPEAWWTAARAVIARVLDQAVAAPLAIAPTGMTRTEVFVDADLRPTRPAIGWRDARATDAPEGPFHPLARCRWVEAHEPEVWQRTVTVLQPKDWLTARLTGHRVADRTSVASLLADDGTLDRARLGHATDRFPNPGEPTDRAGLVRIDGDPVRLNGVPVIVGGQDGWSAACGLGADRAGTGYIVLGTSLVVGVITAGRVTAPGMVTLPWGPGAWHVGGPAQAGADALVWAAEVLGLAGPEALGDLLATEERHARPVLFLPQLSGERVPLWDAARRGAFVGLDRGHRPVDLAWAVVEALGWHARLILDDIAAATPVPLRIAAGGGGLRVAGLGQALATTLGRPVDPGLGSEPGLLGAARAAFRALGLPVPEPQFGPGWPPDPARGPLASDLAAAYRAALVEGQSIAEIARRLASAGDRP